MQDRYLFEYAVIRVMPRVEREEFINVGVILFCAKQKYLKAAKNYRFQVDNAAPSIQCGKMKFTVDNSVNNKFK